MSQHIKKACLALGLVLLLPACAKAADPALAELKPAAGQAAATFAGGCFWCTEADFEKLPGVIKAQSGYSGGDESNPTYEQVASGATGHIEAVRVIYDPKRITYPQLLEHFWRTVDPTDGGGQFCDRGAQYRTAIFVQSDTERAAALASKQQLEKSGQLKKPVATEILRLSAFYAAEDYHQDYYKKNPLRYNYYRTGCGRDRRLQEIWGKHTKS
jgi:methionine-S-sulfoxide reductase